LKGILGKKIGMTQVFDEDGIATAVTVVEAGPCVVLQQKTADQDGYEAIQLGFAEKKKQRANRPELGHAAKVEKLPCKFVREIRGMDLAAYEVGSTVSAEIFDAGEMVDVTGISRGKGFAGSIKRHNQSRGPMSHGSHYHRGPGSLGAIAANRVFKGHNLPGRMGGERKTMQNLAIMKVDKERHLLLIKGAIPGPRKGYVIIRNAVKG